MKDLNKNISIGIAVAIGLFASAWTFNHINPYIGIAGLAIVLWVLINYISKKTENEKKKL